MHFSMQATADTMELHTKEAYSDLDQTRLKRNIESTPELTISLSSKLKITLWFDALPLGLYSIQMRHKSGPYCKQQFPLFLTPKQPFPWFNNVASSRVHIASNDKIIVNSQLEIMCKEAVLACFQMLSLHLSRRTEKTHEKYQVRRSEGPNCNRTPPGYKSESLPSEPPCPVCVKLTLRLSPCQVNYHAMKTCLDVHRLDSRWRW